jgi:membrane protease YdiL (CAAX protease family)
MDQMEMEEAAPSAQNTVSRGRWWLHVLILGAYPLVLGFIGLRQSSENRPIMPGTAGGLIMLALFEMAFFGVLFGMAWFFSRANVDQLYLRWRDGFRPILRGFLYSIGLRLLIIVAVAMVVITLYFIFNFDREQLESARPRVEAVVSPESLQTDPLYFALSLTLISFVVAGFREELWRAGMLAGLQSLFPGRLHGFGGGMGAVTLIAVFFGLGHTPQGWVAVGMTTLLGIGLGAMIVYYRSIWEAVLAHGFFNATSFLMLYWIGSTPL